MSRKRTLLEKTEENILRHELFPNQGRIVVAVSGGVDSMVLLEILHRLSEKYGWEITIGHLNHMLRGKASEEDAAFVCTMAVRLKLKCQVGEAPVEQMAREMRASVEMAGRAARYFFLQETAAEMEAGSIAMAHHADDQVETFWLNLLRGELGHGLGGMHWKRPIIFDSAEQVVRPFLNVWKSEIIEYAKAHKIAYREDASNLETKFRRNEIRLEILPVLEKFQPRIREISLRTAEMIAAEKNFIFFQAVEWLKKPNKIFDQLERALQREVIHVQLEWMRVAPSFDLIEKLRETPEEPVMVSPKRRIYRETSGRLSELPPAQLEYSTKEKQISTAGPGRDGLDDIVIEWEFVRRRGSPERLTEYFDADRIGSSVLLRYWRPGDRFQQSGAAAASKLQDLFTNLKVQAEERRNRLVAQVVDGDVFWVEGLRIGEKFKVSSATRRVLKWSWRREPASPT